MEHYYNREEKARYIDMIIKIVTQEGLTPNEFAYYRILRDKVDPDNALETELTDAWIKAESDRIPEKVLGNRKQTSPKLNSISLDHSQHVKPLVLISVLFFGLIAMGKR
ncbi:MAG TPA: hypothetical protein VK921_20145 [Anditalea sp.]|nr:hypothetical protein [Anditalea sp.]